MTSLKQKRKLYYVLIHHESDEVMVWDVNPHEDEFALMHCDLKYTVSKQNIADKLARLTANKYNYIFHERE